MPFRKSGLVKNKNEENKKGKMNGPKWMENNFHKFEKFHYYFNISLKQKSDVIFTRHVTSRYTYPQCIFIKFYFHLKKNYSGNL